MLTKSLRLAALVVAPLGLLMATSVAQGSDMALQCTTSGAGNWTVTAIGPLSVPCPSGGQCTEVFYDIANNYGLAPDHVVVLAEHDSQIVVPDSRNVFPECDGDNVTFLGIHDCSTRAVRINKDVETGQFALVVYGSKALSSSSIAIKKGKITEKCGIASLGVDRFDENAQRPANTTISFKGCEVTIPTDTLTGEGGEATITGDNCVFVVNGTSVSDAELLVNGTSVGTLTYGEGSISSGTGSCTSKIVNRKLYTWCTCADTDGDGVPNDPIPPCPPTL